MNLKIGVISDTHNYHDKLTIEPCDILLHSGDFTGRGFRDETQDFLEWFEKQPASFKIFIAGNHERGWDREERPVWVAELLAEAEKRNVFYLQDDSIDPFGVKIYGTPWQPEFNNWAFNLPRGSKELKDHYGKMPWDTGILLTHTPPYGVEDYIPENYLRAWETDVSVGCKDLLEHITQPNQDLQYHIFGHIHLDNRNYMNPVQVRRKNTGNDFCDSFITCINAAVVDNAYRVKVKPFYFDYEI